jgi:hypothetical protein
VRDAGVPRDEKTAVGPFGRRPLLAAQARREFLDGRAF